MELSLIPKKERPALFFEESVSIWTEPTPNCLLIKYNILRLYVLWLILKKRVHFLSATLIIEKLPSPSVKPTNHWWKLSKFSEYLDFQLYLTYIL